MAQITDAQFWHRIGAKFRALIPSDTCSLIWRYSLVKKLYTTLSVISDDELELGNFNILVIRAGRKLDQSNPDYAWLSMLAMIGRSHDRNRIDQYDPDLDREVPVNIGTLNNLAKWSAIYAARMEAASLKIEGWKEVSPEHAARKRLEPSEVAIEHVIRAAGKKRQSPETPKTEPDEESITIPAARAARITAYKEECRRAGVKVTDAMIAKAANARWGDRTQVTWWKRNDKRSTAAANRLISAVLTKKPHLSK